MAEHLTKATNLTPCPWLIAVTAGRWQLASIKKAQQLGIKVIAIDSSAEAEGLAVADIAIIAELSDLSKIVQQITLALIDVGAISASDQFVTPAAAQQPISLTPLAVPHSIIKGVLSICSDAGMLLAGQLREYFGITTGPNIEVSKRLINKAHQRQCWKNKEVNGPEFFSANNELALLENARKTPLPFMIKPVDSAGSRGVVKVESYNEPLATYINNALKLSASKEVIIETFMAGEELTVEAFVNKGDVTVLAITEKDKIKATQGLVAYRLATTQMDADKQASIKSLVISAVKALHYLDGPCHAEVIMMHDGTVGMVELAGRGGGFLVFERFVELASGFDIVSNTIKQAVGMTIDTIQRQPQQCILHFFPNEAGTLKSISGFEQAQQVKGIEADAFVTEGITMQDANCDGDRMGYVISYADDRLAAEQQLKQASSHINFTIEPLVQRSTNTTTLKGKQ